VYASMGRETSLDINPGRPVLNYYRGNLYIATEPI